MMMSRNKDTKLTKLFVGGIPYESDDDALRTFFQKFGEIEEAVVIKDRFTKKSKGYGFVTMATSDAAALACENKRPVIDGRIANVNLAYLGAKPKAAKIPGKLSSPAYPFQQACTVGSSPQYVFAPLYSPTQAPSQNSMSPLSIIPPQSPNGQLGPSMPPFQQPCYVDYGGGAMVVFNAVYDPYFYQPTTSYIPSPPGNNSMSQVFTFPPVAAGPATPPLNGISGTMNAQAFIPTAPFEMIGHPQVQCQ
ncbi:hypothetical protein QZH41_013608 [Actinostola sp. cb2023]|nr:hypothetical protein QZH41_013608 [Actinostola sp. cb2023]